MPTGSPPLGRRGQRGLRPPLARRRLTSARAERTIESLATCRISGSPPLARRGLRRGRILSPVVRFTSAPAERTLKNPSARATGRAHLRSRGDDRADVGPLTVVYGSPPLARRGQADVLLLKDGLRITSARRRALPMAGDRVPPPWLASACAERRFRDLRFCGCFVILFSRCGCVRDVTRVPGRRVGTGGGFCR